MIIKSHGICSGTGSNTVAYVQATNQNEAVELLQGDPEALEVADKFAVLAGHTNGLIHITISPNEPLTPEQLTKTIGAINEEFGFSSDDPILLTRHFSRRGNGKMMDHFHYVRPAADGNGRVYRMYRSKKRDEAVSRFCELEYGHQLVSGAHNDFTHKRMLERGLDDFADQLTDLINSRSKSDFGSKENQRGLRLGFDMKTYHHELRNIAALPRNQQPAAFAELIDRFDGIRILQGDKGSRLNLITSNGEQLHNANRILKIKAADVANFIAHTEEYLYDRTEPEPGSRPEHTRIVDDYYQQPGQPTPNEQPDCPTSERSTTDHRQGGSALDAEATELAQAANELKAAIETFTARRKMDTTSADFEALPDLNDPNLMTKLARMLKKSLCTAARSIAPSPIYKPPGAR
ncbi:hypothetical protein [Phaeobacter sp. 11ANDIMAR09]|uniref:hypothetical protein n=1 Tax=Phaeobacter sp. 11ANDIMAR09 TaxID=1225647 RepID=UPI0006C83F54|nr:hypothetical protein [Phaeobacter sp. 11ANDIMAR09]KPD10367.1 hypothetical protein AN476_21355 [Phaeobacter sp. 11ANDIMAR09]